MRISRVLLGKRGRLVSEHAEFFQDELLMDREKSNVKINLHSTSPESELIVRSHMRFRFFDHDCHCNMANSKTYSRSRFVVLHVIRGFCAH